MSIRLQEIRDAQRLALLSASHITRQQAIADFILSCATMAVDLRQMCDARRLCSHPVDNLEEPAAFIADKIAEEFRNIFGHPLFPEESAGCTKVAE